MRQLDIGVRRRRRIDRYRHLLVGGPRFGGEREARRIHLQRRIGRHRYRHRHLRRGPRHETHGIAGRIALVDRERCRLDHHPRHIVVQQRDSHHLHHQFVHRLVHHHRRALHHDGLVTLRVVVVARGQRQCHRRRSSVRSRRNRDLPGHRRPRRRVIPTASGGSRASQIQRHARRRIDNYRRGKRGRDRHRDGAGFALQEGGVIDRQHHLRRRLAILQGQLCPDHRQTRCEPPEFHSFVHLQQPVVNRGHGYRRRARPRIRRNRHRPISGPGEVVSLHRRAGERQRYRNRSRTHLIPRISQRRGKRHRLRAAVLGNGSQGCGKHNGRRIENVQVGATHEVGRRVHAALDANQLDAILHGRILHRGQRHRCTAFDPASRNGDAQWARDGVVGGRCRVIGEPERNLERRHPRDPDPILGRDRQTGRAHPLLHALRRHPQIDRVVAAVDQVGQHGAARLLRKDRNGPGNQGIGRVAPSEGQRATFPRHEPIKVVVAVLDPVVAIELCVRGRTRGVNRAAVQLQPEDSALNGNRPVELNPGNKEPAFEKERSVPGKPGNKPEILKNTRTIERIHRDRVEELLDRGLAFDIRLEENGRWRRRCGRSHREGPGLGRGTRGDRYRNFRRRKPGPVIRMARTEREGQVVGQSRDDSEGHGDRG